MKQITLSTARARGGNHGDLELLLAAPAAIVARSAVFCPLRAFFYRTGALSMRANERPPFEENRLRRVFLEAVRPQERIAARLDQLESARIQREQRRTNDE